MAHLSKSLFDRRSESSRFMGLGGYEAEKLESYEAGVRKKVVAFWPPSLPDLWLPGKRKH